MKGYKTSKDYTRLKELLDMGYKVICLWSQADLYSPIISIAEKIRGDIDYYAVANWTCSTESKDFALFCELRQVEFIEPNDE